MGPILKRYIAVIGLLGLIPIGYLLVAGRLTAADAGARGAIVIVAVLVLLRLAGLFPAPPTRSTRRAADQTAG